MSRLADAETTAVTPSPKTLNSFLFLGREKWMVQSAVSVRPIIVTVSL